MAPDLSPLLKLYARHRLKVLHAQDPVETQRHQLTTLVRSARHTAFGKAHGFDRIRTVEDFQKAVPIRTYEDFWRDWWHAPHPHLADVTTPGRVAFLAVSSGTTSGATKFIPVNQPMVQANKRAAIDTVTHHLAAHPAGRPLSGRTFMMGGSTELVQEAPGVLSGDLSGIAYKTQSRWMRPFSWPPPETALLENWEEKLRRFTRDGFEQNISIWTGVPSWMLILLEQMREQADGRPLFPKLQLLVHGGVAWDLYKDRFADFLAETGAATREVYPASEGFIAVQDRDSGEGLRLILDNGLFFEFVPLEELDSPSPTRHWTGNLQTGVDYAIVLTSNAGLWSYLIGDTIRLVDRTPPRLLITGRTSYMLSAFGEHLIGSEIDRAILESTEAEGVTLAEYTVGAVIRDGSGGKGGHVWLVELQKGGNASADALARRIDEALCRINDDYRAHRTGGTGMDAPEVRLVPPGSFERWMAALGKSGGQHKVPRVMTDTVRFNTMLTWFAARD